MGAEAALAAAVAVAFFVETITGFGGTVVAVALASFFVPVRDYLPAHVTVNVLLSAWIAARDRASIDRALLLQRVLPAMLLGFPLGAWAFSGLSAHAHGFEAAFGAFVALVGTWRLLAPGRTMGPRLANATLGLAGVVHGAFGTGGPMVVMALSRLGLDKHAFRATLSALWVVLSVFLLAVYAHDGVLGRDSFRLSAWLVPGLAVGMVLGQRVHARVDAERFRRGVDATLALAGVLILVRSL